MGYLPRTSFDWSSTDAPRSVRDNLSKDDACKYAERMQEAWKSARTNLEKAQKAMTKQANKKALT